MFLLDYLYSLPENTTGIDDIAVQTLTIVPGFTSMILFFMFLVIAIGGISRQKLRTGTADYSSWCLIASLAVFILGLLFSTIQGFIGLDVLIITLSLTIISSVWFFLDRKYTEV